MKISVTIICHNNEDTIDRTLASLGWADEIIVVDDYSTDSTPEICKKYDLRFFQKEWVGFSAQKNWAAEQASNEWILTVDSDEVVSPELAESLQEFDGDASEHIVYMVTRRAEFMGKWINYSGWYPDYKARLYYKDKAGWDSKEWHEKIEFDGSPGKLKGDLLHYTYRDMPNWLARKRKETDRSSSDEAGANPLLLILRIILSGPIKFIKMYFIKRGFLDGYRGLFLASIDGYFTSVKYFKALRKKM